MYEVQNSEDIKEQVKSKYATIALTQVSGEASGCCGVDIGCGTVNISESYSNIAGYEKDADLGLGCGLPTIHSIIKHGDTVVDLGSGAGNDAFVAAKEVGENGKVIGIDFTPAMIEKAKANAIKLNLQDRVTFVQGDIENIPLNENSVDVVLSNCVLNLVPNKSLAFQNIFRILKQNGHFSVSDVVIEGNMPESAKKDAELYAGCISGASDINEYLNIISESGFKNIKVNSKKRISLPDSILSKYEIENTDKFPGIFSINVFAEK